VTNLMITDGLRLFSSVKFRKWLLHMYVGKLKFIFPICSSNCFKIARKDGYGMKD